MEKIQCPGLLIECGFLSNREEAEKLQTAQYQRKIACVIVSVLSRHINTLHTT
jgi:N-acetylmuramoyl-L-alanine amidase